MRFSTADACDMIETLYRYLYRRWVRGVSDDDSKGTKVAAKSLRTILFLSAFDDNNCTTSFDDGRQYRGLVYTHRT
jgi:hypothetical protein